MKADPYAPIGLALIGLLLALLCWRIWGFGIAHTDDATWALESHQRHAHTVISWARSQGRLWALPVGTLMLHALHWQGTLYGELLRTGSFAIFFIVFNVMVATYCDRAIAVLTATLVLGLFVLTLDGGVLTTYPLLVWPSATAFCGAVLLGRRFIAGGHVGSLAGAGILLFASLFNNEGMTLLFCCVFGLTICANDRQVLGGAASRWGPFRHARSVALVAALLGVSALYLTASWTWSLLNRSNYDGHVLGAFWPSQFGAVLLSFASASTILSWFFRPYEVMFSDPIGGFGARISYSLTDALTGIGTAPLAVVVGIIAASLFFWSAMTIHSATRAPKSSASKHGPYWAMALGLAITFIHILPVAITAKYQSWHFQQGILAYPTSLIAHFGLCLFLAGAFAAILQLPWRAVVTGFAFLICLGFGLLAALAYRASDQIAADMRPETGRWRVMAMMLPGLDLLAPDTKVVLAPRLAGGSWYVAVPHTYWTDYLAARYQRILRVKTDTYTQDDLQQGVVTLDYALMDDERSFAVTLSRHRRPLAGDPRVDSVDAIAVRVDRATSARLGQSVLSYRNGRNIVSQVPLSDLPSSEDGAWRILKGIDAEPMSVHLQRRSQMSQSRLACGHSLLANTLVTFGSSVVSSGPSCAGRRYLGAGWGLPEATGVWTTADKAQIKLPARGLPAGELEAVLNASSFTGLGFYPGVQRVTVEVSGKPLAEWSFMANQPRATRFHIPAEARNQDGDLDVTFSIHDPVQPSAAGLSPDQRKLGLNLCSLLLRPAEESYAPLPRSSCITDTQ
ncbi:hypothetical protein [Bosea sp. LjRoot237]|uniref:hypothetical protein n=1 Tax=Bosea sp. LjRoot237 TaxID=3342292 RepID=UPI003ECD5972